MRLAVVSVQRRLRKTELGERDARRVLQHAGDQLGETGPQDDGELDVAAGALP